MPGSEKDKAPETLYVSSPNGRQNCAGEYTLFAWERPNGQHLWKQKDGECWLYSSINGRWVIGGFEAKNKNFECSTGYIASQKLHGGQSPEKFNGTWEMARWHEDSTIKVAAVGDTAPNGVPAVLEIISPTGRKQCSGEYTRVLGEMPNGKPVWKQRNGEHWLYSGTRGTWLVGGVEEKSDNFSCSSGVIVCGQPHRGVMPDKVPGPWWWTGRSLDDGIRITAGTPSDNGPASSNGRLEERLPRFTLLALLAAVLFAAVASVRADFLSSPQVSCTSRWPVIGESVQRSDGQEEQGDWKLRAGSVATVTEIGNDGDFKLRNPEGRVSGWKYRKYFSYLKGSSAQAGTSREPFAAFWGLLSQGAASLVITTDLVDKIKTAMIVLLGLLCYRVRVQGLRALKEKDTELQSLQGQLAQSGIQLNHERSKVAQLGEELKAQRCNPNRSMAQSFCMDDDSPP